MEEKKVDIGWKVLLKGNISKEDYMAEKIQQD